MKKIGIVVIACIAALSLMLVGCGSSSKKLVKDGTLTVLTNPEYEPFEYIEGDQIVGYDMDLAKLVADKLGLKLEIVNMDFDSLIPAVTSGNKGDIIFTRKLDDQEKLTLEKDTIITYKAIADDGSNYINTHRIIEVIDEGESSVEYKTQGDNNEYPDSYTVRPADIISIYVEGEDTRIPVLGNVINFLLQPTGFFFVIVIPLIIFFLFEIIVFVKKLLEVKNSDKKKISAADEELIKQKAIEEYIKAQQAEKEAAEAEEKEEKKEEPSDKSAEE